MSERSQPAAPLTQSSDWIALGVLAIALLVVAFGFRSLASGAVEDVDVAVNRLLDESGPGEDLVISPADACDGAAIAPPFHVGDGSETVTVGPETTMSSFRLRSAVARIHLDAATADDGPSVDDPAVDGPAVEVAALALDELHLRKDMVLRLQERAGQWCVSSIEVGATVHGPGGVAVDDSPQELLARSTAPDQPSVEDAIECECLNAAETALLADLEATSRWGQTD